MSIYFKPTWLYIKQHNQTGLLYFGKTVQDPTRYNGSGTYWNSHLKIHGKDIETLWYCLFTEQEELVKFALMCSEQWNIVAAVNQDGKKTWANVKPENGLDGGNNFNSGTKGIPLSKERKEHLSKINTGKTQSEKTRNKRSASLKGRVFSEDTLSKLRKPKSPRTAEHSRNQSLARKGKPWSEARRLAQNNRSVK